MTVTLSLLLNLKSKRVISPLWSNGPLRQLTRWAVLHSLVRLKLFFGVLALDPFAVFANSSAIRHFIHQLQPVSRSVGCYSADAQATQRVVSAARDQMVNLVDGPDSVHRKNLGNRSRR